MSPVANGASAEVLGRGWLGVFPREKWCGWRRAGLGYSGQRLQVPEEFGWLQSHPSWLQQHPDTQADVG